jgi:hypothetical protein
VIRERKRTRDKTRDRVAEGRYQRSIGEHLQQRTETATDRREEAMKLREEGLSWKEVGERMSLSEGAAKKLGYRAKK